jgi:hypothetical protein
MSIGVRGVRAEQWKAQVAPFPIHKLHPHQSKQRGNSLIIYSSGPHISTALESPRDEIWMQLRAFSRTDGWCLKCAWWRTGQKTQERGSVRWCWYCQQPGVSADNYHRDKNVSPWWGHRTMGISHQTVGHLASQKSCCIQCHDALLHSSITYCSFIPSVVYPSCATV